MFLLLTFVNGLLSYIRNSVPQKQIMMISKLNLFFKIKSKLHNQLYNLTRQNTLTSNLTLRKCASNFVSN